jgi:hypothetical protein
MSLSLGLDVSWHCPFRCPPRINWPLLEIDLSGCHEHHRPRDITIHRYCTVLYVQPLLEIDLSGRYKYHRLLHRYSSVLYAYH